MESTAAMIAPLADLSDVLILGQSVETSLDGVPQTVRRYAGGRRRVVTQPGTTRTVQVEYRAISRSDFDSLRDLAGEAVLFRDQRQRRVYGILSDIEANELRPYDLLETIRFTITEISHTEAV